ncbi:CU044_2847 family protein [Streptomyces sp. V4-01]|uniref:CU044_2847 family protein n=1 Tax=Actinacidiphila polyblastidii TaxID=3110430 RepID=A0ABU7PII7_9ACTN|nr:CU044_2847 family protein [Streptomyces sp. V4-01]
MSDAVQFALSDGTVVLVAPTARAGSGAVGLGGRLETAQRTLRTALAPITAAAAEVIDEFRGLAHRPDEVEVSFGVVLDGKLGGIIASANGSAHLDVSLRWQRADSDRGAAPEAEPLPAAHSPEGPDPAAATGEVQGPDGG